MQLALGNGRSIGYLASGQGPVIIRLHPVGLNAHFWDSVTDYLLVNYRIIAIDCPGHGDSDVTLAFLSLDEIVGDICTLIAALVPQGAVIAGCSLSGMLTQGVALRRPDLVRGVVISNAGHDATMLAERHCASAVNVRWPACPPFSTTSSRFGSRMPSVPSTPKLLSRPAICC